jgi:hypothetical protein
MTLEEAIHWRWAHCDALSDVAPASAVWTGNARGATPPYVVIERLTSRPVVPTNGADRFDEISLAMTLWTGEYSTGLAAMREIRAAFDRARLALDASGGIARFRRTADETSQSDRLWRFTVRFAVQVFVAAEPA